jgi:hypothetical protein
MILKQGEITMTLDDSSADALKIEQGFDYTLNQDGTITFGEQGADFKNKYRAVRAIQNASTVAELKQVLISIVKKLL